MSQAAADRALLTGANPFSDPVARLDTEGAPPPDVAQLHSNVRDELRALIEQVRVRKQPSMGLVVGDPGQGKTHQLAWLRYHAAEGQYYFVEIPPLKDPAAPFAHILRYMVQGLRAHPAAAGAPGSSLDRLLWECLRRIAVAVRGHALAEGDAATATVVDEALLGDEHYVDTFGVLAPAVSDLGALLYRHGRGLAPLTALLPEMGRVLCRLPDRAAQAAVYDWLRGAELADEDLTLLGVRRGVESEDRAFEVLRALVSMSFRPIALCFDQLESTAGGLDGARALFDAVMAIYHQIPACLVLMCQTQFWVELRDQVVSQAARDRVHELPRLAYPTPDEALRLVEARLATLWRATKIEPPYPSYPFEPGFVRAHVAQVRPTVRRVLSDAGNWLEAMRRAGAIAEVAGAAPAPIAPRPDAVKIALAAARDQKLAALAGGEPSDRQEYLRASVVRMLEACRARGRAVGGIRIISVEDPPRPRAGQREPALVTLEGGGVSRRVALDVHSGDARSVWRVLDRLNLHVEGGRSEAAVLLREAEVVLGENAKATLALAQKLERAGGGIVYLERDVAVRLVAAELLLDAVGAAEVWVGDRTALHEEALSFLLEDDGVPSLLAPALSGLVPARGQPGMEDEVLRMLRQKSPVKIAALATALGHGLVVLEAALTVLEQTGKVIVGQDRDRARIVALRGRAKR